MVLEQVLRSGAAWVVAIMRGAVQDVLPQLLAKLALRPKLAVVLALSALGAMPEEQQPPLLLLDVLRLHCIALITCIDVKECDIVCSLNVLALRYSTVQWCQFKAALSRIKPGMHNYYTRLTTQKCREEDDDLGKKAARSRSNL